MEKLFYQEQVLDLQGKDHYIQVTDKFIKYDNKSIPLNKINSVHVNTFAKKFPSKTLIGIGVGILLFLFTGLLKVVGLVLISSMIAYIYYWSKNKYFAKISFETSSAVDHSLWAKHSEIYKLRNMEEHILEKITNL